MAAAPGQEQTLLFASSSDEDEGKETGNNDNKKRKSKKVSKLATPAVHKKRMKRGPGFTKEELKNFLDLMEEVVPIGPQQWETVADRHLESYPDQGRDTSSLRTKFNRLVSATPPTGDPSCPEEVRRAKRIYKLIEEKADASQLLDMDEIGLDSDKEQSTDGNEKVVSGVPMGSSASSINTPNTSRFRNPRTPQSATSSQMEKLMEVMVANMMMDQSRRTEREEERRQREEERRERSLDQSMAAKRQDMMMMMMMGFVAKMSGTQMPNPNDEEDEKKTQEQPKE